MSKKNVTIYDVAREAGVSMATVSRVVNGNPNVRPKTRDKVLEVVEKLNYRPNAVARGLASKKTRYVGVLMPNITNPYYSALAYGIDDVAAMYEYNIILSNADPSREEKAISSLLDKQVDGIIAIGEGLSSRGHAMLESADIPVIYTDYNDPSGKFLTVNIDVEKAYFEVTSRFVKQGYQHIALIGVEETFNKNSRKLSGFLKAFEENSVKPDSAVSGFVKIPTRTYQDGYNIWQKVVDESYDAAVIIDDTVAAGLLNGLMDHGIKVPDDFAMITSNNTDVVRASRPRLSTIEPPIYDIGAVAMRTLTKLMDNQQLEDFYYLPYDINYQETTKNNPSE